MKKEVGKNVSSGAEKVERVEEKISPESVNEKSPAKAKKPAKQTAQKQKKPAEKKPASNKTKQAKAEREEKIAADRRVEAAKARAEKKAEKAKKKASVKEARIEKRARIKEKRLEKKQALAEKKIAKKQAIAEKKANRAAARQEHRAELKEKKAERRAEHVARRETLRHETKAEREKRREREKKERFALKEKRRAAREKAREEKMKSRENARSRRAQDRRNKREKREARRGGYGGWLAAVISLGTACLVLATIVTAGAFRMNDMTIASESGYRSTLYEMVATSEEIDNDLSKLRVSSGANEQRRLLTDILVNSALLESASGKIPVEAKTSTDISGFVNRTSDYAESMLKKVSAGAPLSSAEKEKILSLYETNGKLYQELNDLATDLDAKEFTEFLKGKGGAIADRFTRMGAAVRGEELFDAPFSEEGNVGKNRLEPLAEISSSEAQKRAMEYFTAYHVKDAAYTGETITRDVTCYNFVLTDENDVEIFCEITKKGGKLAFFNTYEECATKNFDLATCDAIAREYLSTLGITEAEAVWLSDGGMVANLTYTTVEDGVRIYPETIRVRVCEEKGRVIGLDAYRWLVNNEERELTPTMSREEAQQMLDAGLVPYVCNLALISQDGREILCYEFGCSYGEDEYLVYLDANTGDETEIFLVHPSAQGSYLK